MLINVTLNSKMQNRILDTVLQEVGLCKQKTLDIRQKKVLKSFLIEIILRKYKKTEHSPRIIRII